MSRKPYTIGIDEVGRGPLAGPVAVGALRASPRALRAFRDIRESKQLSKQKRGEWVAKMRAYRSAHPDDIDWAVAFVSASVIDKIGIAPSIRRALRNALNHLAVAPEQATVLLDGGLKAPPEYRDQKTIIRGDASETVIAMASVVAKVARDKRMALLARKYSKWGFANHVGYGTKDHISAIKKYGLSPEHRRTFCRGIIDVSREGV
jgi:ribonuclease HII